MSADLVILNANVWTVNPAQPRAEAVAVNGERIAAVPRPFIDYVRGLTDETISAKEGRKSVEMVLGSRGGG